MASPSRSSSEIATGAWDRCLLKTKVVVVAVVLDAAVANLEGRMMGVSDVA